MKALRGTGPGAFFFWPFAARGARPAKDMDSAPCLGTPPSGAARGPGGAASRRWPPLWRKGKSVGEVEKSPGLFYNIMQSIISMY